MGFLPIFLFFAIGLALWLLVVRENLRQRQAQIGQWQAQLANLPPGPEASDLQARLQRAVRAYNRVRRSAPAKLPAQVFGFQELAE
jgi:hypothetical protein